MFTLGKIVECILINIFILLNIYGIIRVRLSYLYHRDKINLYNTTIDRSETMAEDEKNSLRVKLKETNKNNTFNYMMSILISIISLFVGCLANYIILSAL